MYAQYTANSPTPTQPIQAQEKQFDLKIQLQNQKIESLKSKVGDAINYQALRKDVLDSQEKSINWWLSVIAIFLTLFAIVTPIYMRFFEDKTNKHVNQIKEMKQKVEKIKKEAEKDSYKIKEITNINAQQNAENPKNTQIEKAKQHGTKLDKLIASALELQNKKSIKEAIDKWREILEHAYRTNNQNLQASCCFNLGFLYSDNEKYHVAIEFYQKAIEIKPDKYEAYNNMGIAYADLKQYQQAIEAYQKAVEIKSDYYMAYCNMGGAYDAMENFAKAIDSFNNAIKVNPNIGKEIGNWKFLTHRIKTLDDPTIKQQYQRIFNHLKDGKNKK